MDQRQHEQVGRIIAQSLTTSRACLPIVLNTIYAEHSKAGRLASGMTVMVGMAAIERAGTDLLNGMIARLTAVATDLDVFEALANAQRKWLRMCDDEAKELARMASAQGAAEPDAGVLALARQELDRIKKGVEQRLAIERYAFEEASPAQIAPHASPERKGGRPPAQFWDDMWAAIAVQLYDGSLQPKTQADVERAMADWITANDHSAADSTVRARARRLWDGLSKTDA